MAAPSQSESGDTTSTPGYVQFIENGSGYVYDAGAHSIHKLSGNSYRILEDYLALSAGDLRRKYRTLLGPQSLAVAINPLARLRDRGALQPLPRRDYSAVLASGYLEERLSSQLNQLVLHCTEQCNQRCAYCVNSGGYLGEYVHNDKRMTWEIARQSIDYFLPRTAVHGIAGIAFFGGEPLLCWDLIEKSVRYVRKHYALMDNLPLTVATNLTLLESSQLDFLVKNQINLQVSLDGPREIHDAARVTASGEGTHTAVVEKLKEIRFRHPKYYAENLAINCALDPANDPFVVFQYFSADLFAGLRIGMNRIKEDDSGRYPFSPEATRCYNAGLDRIIEAYLSSFGDSSNFNYTLFERLFVNIYNFARQKGTAAANDDNPFNLICLPGVQNLYVSADGVFYPCEQFRCRGCEIGDYGTGFDIDKLMKLMATMAQFCGQKCQDCWAYRLCGHCWLHFIDRGQISEDKKAQRCEVERANLLEALRRYVKIRENEPPAAFRNSASLHFIENQGCRIRERERRKRVAKH